MSEKLYVVKVGGNVIEDSAKIGQFLNAFHQLNGKKILVHGGGKLATSVAEKLGIEVKMLEGRRITDKEMIDVVTMVYGGLVNKQLVAKLQAIGCNALGLTGADGDLITSHRRAVKNGVDYGYVGDPYRVNITLMDTLLESGAVPVVAPLTHDGHGDILNTNADTMASEIAQAMGLKYEVSLVYAFELKGVLKSVNDENSLIRHIDHASFEHLKAEGVVHSGMLPKLANALNAVSKGVKNVNICHFSAIGSLSNSGFSEYTKIEA